MKKHTQHLCVLPENSDDLSIVRSSSANTCIVHVKDQTHVLPIVLWEVP